MIPTEITKKASIIIPSFNRESLIGETLDSVLNQSYKNWECIIVDDGSTDNTKEVILSYIIKDNRLKYYDRPNNYKSGGAGARNFGFKMAKGEYIQFLDSDDLLHPLKLEIQIKRLDEDQEANYCVCENVVFTKKLNNINRSWFSSKSDSKNRLYDYVVKKLGIQTASAIFRRSFLEKIKAESGLFNQDLSQSQEWELYCRIIEKDSNYLYIPDILLYIRDNQQSITSDFIKLKPHTIYSQIKALKSIYSYLKEKGRLTQELNKYFVNSGITIMKRIISNKLDKSLKTECNDYILGCLNQKTSSYIYRIRYTIGKKLWTISGRGHFLLKY